MRENWLAQGQSKPFVIGIDTSCYTTSVACVSPLAPKRQGTGEEPGVTVGSDVANPYDGIVFQKRTMLSVPLGNRGLRQSDAVFMHIRNLPPLVEALFSQVHGGDVGAVCVSAKPTAGAESYMPVFLAGVAVARSVAAALGVPLYEQTHQAGHVRAALLHNEHLFYEKQILALHLSGGTTDILLVELDGVNRTLGAITPIGGSDDLHAGQFVDRVGVRLGLPFPSGQSLEKLARLAAHKDIRLPSNVRGLCCSFSGQETKALRLWDEGALNEEIAYAVYDCLARTVAKLIRNAVQTYGDLPVLLSGGVSSSVLLRELLSKRLERKLYYAQEGLSADNAVGTALLGLDRRRQPE